MKYCFDIDGVICTNTDGKYEEACPLYERIAVINDLFDSGHEILLFTSRGATTGKNWRILTEKQLKMWNVRYHELMTNKPHYDIIVDDKAINDVDFFKLFVE